MHQVPPRSYAFGRFVLDLDRHRLLFDGALVELPSRALFVLRALTESPGQTLSKQTIAARAWPDAHASDANLMVQISKLRAALRRGGDGEGWIRTVRGQGYRFDADVRSVTVAEVGSGPVPIATDDFERELRAGIAAVHEFDPVNATRAAEYFDHCLELRPDDGTALAYRAVAWINQWYLGIVSGREAARVAPGLARRALERAPGLAMAHVAAGAMSYAFGRDFAASDRSLRHALRLDDQCGAAHEYLAYSLLARARFEEGRHHLRLAQWRNPSHHGLIAHTGTAYYLERRFDRAIASFEAALALYPEHLFALSFCALSHAYDRDFPQADSVQRKLFTLAGDVPLVRSIHGTISALRGAEAKAREALDWLRSPQPMEVPPLLLATVEATLGEHDAAMRNLQASIDDPFPALCVMAVEPVWDPLREREDFQQLLARLNLQGIA